MKATNQMSIEALKDTGILWLINRVVFHPRGYALALNFNENDMVEGWVMLGDGSDVWSFTEDMDDTGFLRSSFFLQKVSEINRKEESEDETGN